ncbi:uncharacterized protein LOC133347946 [Lethenteron reissneri]|uniref:uncharacterized protein LOC133347946 n=1 Tax=Lethenteron reissneri TaxID=7753 RepID=UPI002AB71A9D|nr:uncharacterized protein LOC133347946 [Lethenteron reissneri]
MSLSFAGLSLVLAVTLALGVTRGDGTCAITNPIASGFASTIAELSNNLPRDYVVTALSVHPGVMEKDVCRALRALLVLRPTLQRLQENVEERTLIYNSTRTLLSSLAFYGYVHFSGLPLACTTSSSMPQRSFFSRLRSDMEAASRALDSSCPFDDPGRDVACGPPACPPRHGEAGRAVDSAATASDSGTDHSQAGSGGGGAGGTLGTMLLLGLMSALSSLLLGMLLGWLIARKQARSRKQAPQAPEGDPLRRQRQADERETTRPETRRLETSEKGPPEKEKKNGPVVGNLVARLGPTRTTRDPGGGRRCSVRKLRSGGRGEAERWRKGTKMPAV